MLKVLKLIAGDFVIDACHVNKRCLTNKSPLLLLKMGFVAMFTDDWFRVFIFFFSVRHPRTFTFFLFADSEGYRAR